ncbi:Very-long-chain aldehyde decarbonylase GL1-5 [Linum grandiflorum]
MASRPGILTHWPWESLGSFKYLILAPWVAHNSYKYITVGGSKYTFRFHIFPFILLRILHNKIWIDVSRRRTAAPANRIVDKPIDDDQLDRESNWDDQIVMTGIIMYGLTMLFEEQTSNVPIWRTDGVVLAALTHAGPVEFLYYWLHRALHHHFLYSRYHSHHHSSIVTQPITSVIHPFVETMSYIVLFAIPQTAVLLSGTGSYSVFFGYILFIDFMNNMGHCNFRSPFDYYDDEQSKSSFFSAPLKLLFYTPSRWPAMASKPGILTHWPWESLGSFKYLILAPWVAHSSYNYFTVPDSGSKYTFSFLIVPFMVLRILHNKIWIDISSRRTAAPANRIVDKPIDDDQLHRESNWDDQIVMTGLLMYIATVVFEDQTSNFPIWRTDGVVWTALIHVGPVEFLYYWLHRALHHHFLYSRYHSHHHSSIATRPITSVIHPFVETMSYIVLFAIPTVSVIFSGTSSYAALFGYLLFIDFMNNMGHCNFRSPFDYYDDEQSKSSVFSAPLKLLFYTPSYHSVHHTKFQKNYSLFMPFYDYIYGTMESSHFKGKKDNGPQLK